jgi:integrase
MAGTKQSFYTYRAALVHEARTELRTALRDRDVASRAHNTEQKLNAETRIKTHTETLTKYAPSSGDREQDMQRKSAYTGARTSERSNGKREALDSRPPDWRDRVWKEVQPRDRDAVAVTALTGARPAEVEKGVSVHNTGDSLRITISGAKTNGVDRGQEQRTITISKAEAAKSSEGRHLLAAVKEGQTRTVKIGDAANFSDRVRHASERAMPDEKTVSPYDYRHGFSARIKDDERLTPSDRAAALGQQSERSQSAYAGASSSASAGAGSISGASASSATR